LATHSLGHRLGAKVLKVGLVKAGGGAAVALAIPVAAVGIYAMPVSAIKQLASPIVGAAPDIFDTRALARVARERFQRAVEPGHLIGGCDVRLCECLRGYQLPRKNPGPQVRGDRFDDRDSCDAARHKSPFPYKALDVLILPDKELARLTN
jgi:hypothetical protein